MQASASRDAESSTATLTPSLAKTLTALQYLPRKDLYQRPVAAVSDLFDTDKSAISKRIKKLIDFGYITEEGIDFLPSEFGHLVLPPQLLRVLSAYRSLSRRDQKRRPIIGISKILINSDKNKNKKSLSILRKKGYLTKKGPERSPSSPPFRSDAVVQGCTTLKEIEESIHKIFSPSLFNFYEVLLRTNPFDLLKSPARKLARRCRISRQQSSKYIGILRDYGIIVHPPRGGLKALRPSDACSCHFHEDNIPCNEHCIRYWALENKTSSRKLPRSLDYNPCKADVYEGASTSNVAESQTIPAVKFTMALSFRRKRLKLQGVQAARSTSVDYSNSIRDVVPKVRENGNAISPITVSGLARALYSTGVDLLAGTSTNFRWLDENPTAIVNPMSENESKSNRLSQIDSNPDCPPPGVLDESSKDSKRLLVNSPSGCSKQRIYPDSRSKQREAVGLVRKQASKPKFGGLKESENALLKAYRKRRSKVDANWEAGETDKRYFRELARRLKLRSFPVSCWKTYVDYVFDFFQQKFNTNYPPVSRLLSVTFIDMFGADTVVFLDANKVRKVLREYGYSDDMAACGLARLVLERLKGIPVETDEPIYNEALEVLMKNIPKLEIGRRLIDRRPLGKTYIG